MPEPDNYGWEDLSLTSSSIGWTGSDVMLDEQINKDIEHVNTTMDHDYIDPIDERDESIPGWYDYP